MTTEELNALIVQAEGGDVSAMNQVAHVYSDNADFKDSEKAFLWYKKSAELGNVNSMANLGGWCYMCGNGTEKNIPFADEWLKKSVENGWIWTWAFNELANIYVNDAQYKDSTKAFYWYSKSAETRDRLGMSNLGGWCYLWGNGVEKDVDKAIYWLSKAADECGDIWSMNKLTYIYGELEGYINNEQAAKWFLELIKRDCDPNSGVYENTGYNKDLYEKVKNAILNSSSENDILSSLSGSTSGGSLLGGSISVVSSNAKSYINQAEEVLAKKEAAEHEKIFPLIENDCGIGESPFRNTSGKFIIPDGTRRIGKCAFMFCKGLTSIVIPESVTSIGDCAFKYCERLTSVIIPSSVTSIGKGAFEKCENLTSVVIPDSLTNIGEEAFRDCCSLTSVVIPNSVTSIGKHAFSGCKSFTSVNIPDGVASIGDFAFDSCTGLTSIVIPNSVTSIGKCAFYCCKLSAVKLGRGVLNIGVNAFWGNPIQNIIVPQGTRQRFENMEELNGREDKIIEE